MSDQRKQQLKEWAEVQKSLEEAMEVLEVSPDAENMAQVEAFEAEFGDCAARLNASEADLGISPTVATGLKFVQVGKVANNSPPPAGAPSPTSPAASSSSPSASNTTVTVCLMPEAAPYQVLYDGRKWYSCVIVSVVPPRADDRLSRYRYKVFILGYNCEEEVYAEELRRWELDLSEPITAGQKVFAIHPTLGKFLDAEVDKLTPKNTVMVKFVPAAEEDSQVDELAEDTIREVPISHVLNGKWFRQIKKTEKLSAEDKKAKAKERKAKQKAKDEERRRIEQEAAFSAMTANAEFLDL